jgi:hypothetical protein
VSRLLGIEKSLSPNQCEHCCRCGRVRLTGVVVRNAGIDWSNPENCYWQHKVARREAVRIILHGQSEIEASNVVLEGDLTFEVRAHVMVRPPYGT